MRYRVIKKFENSSMCLVCGLENKSGLKASFYELENNTIAGIFIGKNHHQSYPGIIHGGIISAMLDETIGRAISLKNTMIWGVTAELKIRFLEFVPICVKLIVIGEITLDRKNYFEAKGKLILPNGKIAATGEGKFIKKDLKGIIKDTNPKYLKWDIYPKKEDPEFIEY